MTELESRPNGWYRSEEGVFLGLCKGLAEWRDLPVFWVRFAFIILSVITGLFPIAVIAYIVMSFIIPKAPEKAFQSPPTLAPKIKSVKQMLEALERRTRRVEEAVVNRENDWDRRFYDR